MILLREGAPIGAREVQRKLSFSSPSVAAYHLEKLYSMKLISRDSSGKFFLEKRSDISNLKDILVLRLASRVYMLPRFSLYLAFFLIMLLGYIFLFTPTRLTTDVVFAVLFGSTAIVVTLYETLRSYNRKGF